MQAATTEALEEALAPCVSEAAVFIRTNAPEPVGDRVRIQLSLAGGDTALSIVGTVAWVFPQGAAPVGRPAGMGILVEAGDDESLARLDRIQQRGSSSPLARIPGASFWRFALPDGSAAKFGNLDRWRREGAIAPQQEWRENSVDATIPMAVKDSIPSDDPELLGATSRLEGALSGEGDIVPSASFFERAVRSPSVSFSDVSGAKGSGATESATNATETDFSAPAAGADAEAHRADDRAVTSADDIAVNDLPGAERIHDEPTQISAPMPPADGPAANADPSVNVRTTRSHAPSDEAVSSSRDEHPTLVATTLGAAPKTSLDSPRKIEDDSLSSGTKTELTAAPDPTALSPALAPMDDEDVFAAAEAEDGEDTDRTSSRNEQRGFDADEGPAAMTLPRQPRHGALVSGSDRVQPTRGDAPIKSVALGNGFEPSLKNDPPPGHSSDEAKDVSDASAVETILAPPRRLLDDSVPEPPPLGEAGFSPNSDEEKAAFGPTLELYDRASEKVDAPEPVIHRMPQPDGDSPLGIRPALPVAPPKKRKRPVPRPKIGPKSNPEGPALEDAPTQLRPMPSAPPPAPPVFEAPALANNDDGPSMTGLGGESLTPFSEDEAPVVGASSLQPGASLDADDPESGVFYDTSDTTNEVESMKSLVTLDDEEDLPDLPTQTSQRVRPVIKRLFTESRLPRPQPWPKDGVDAPEIFGVAARFSRVRDVEEKGEQTMVEALKWPFAGTTRTSVFDTRAEDDSADEPPEDSATSGLIGDRIRIGSTGSFAEDDALGLDVTDPSTLTHKVGNAFNTPDVDSDDDAPGIAQAPQSSIATKAPSSGGGSPSDAPQVRFVPTALFVRVDGAQAVLFDVGTKLPARVVRALPSEGHPVTVEILEGEAVIGDLLWASSEPTLADLSCEVEGNGIVFVLIQDPGGQSLTARLQTSWATA